MLIPLLLICGAAAADPAKSLIQSEVKTLTIKYGDMNVVIGANFTKAQTMQALIQAQKEMEAIAAEVEVNEIPTHQWSMQFNEMRTANGPPVSKLEQAPKVEAWFINSAGHAERKACMEKQLENSGYAPLRFSKDTDEDCLANGIEENDFKDMSAGARKNALASWCSHKRLFQALAAAPSAADYFLVLEDTPVLNPRSLKPTVDWLAGEPKLSKTFDLVQLDPYGGIAEPFSFYQGRPVWKPSTDELGRANKAYQGSHALLVRKSVLPKINEFMSSNKATLTEKLILNIPKALAISTGAAMNPMVNKLGAYTPMPTFCESNKAKSSLIEADAQTLATDDEDIWGLWARGGNDDQNAEKMVWHVPAAKNWVSLGENLAKPDVQDDTEIEVWRIGTKDELPERSTCIENQLSALGLPGRKRMEFVNIPKECSMNMMGAAEYGMCLAQNGLSDCSFVGHLDATAVKGSQKLQLATRDHAVSGVCTFKKLLSKVEGSKGSPYILALNEDVVLTPQAKQNIVKFIKETQDRDWRAVQIDPYGREAPLKTGKVWTPAGLSQEQAKSRFWGLHAVLLKREEAPKLLEDLQIQAGTIGVADRIPLRTNGWLSANLGVAYDPHMGDMLRFDQCKQYPSTASHFQIERKMIPDSWDLVKEDVQTETKPRKSFLKSV